MACAPICSAFDWLTLIVAVIVALAIVLADLAGLLDVDEPEA